MPLDQHDVAMASDLDGDLFHRKLCCRQYSGAATIKQQPPADRCLAAQADADDFRIGPLSALGLPFHAPLLPDAIASPFADNCLIHRVGAFGIRLPPESPAN